MNIFKRGKHRAPRDRKTMELTRLREEIADYRLAVSRLSDDRDRVFRINVGLRQQISELTDQLGEARAPVVIRSADIISMKDTAQIPVLIPPARGGYRPNWALNDD